MGRRTSKSLAAALAFALAVASCGDIAPDAAIATDTPAVDESAEKQRLGLMTSLPIYWPLGTGIGDFASGSAETPWQRIAIESEYEIVALDTLSPIAGIAPGDPETDPLENLDRLAVIQPRGLSPSDNVAVDEWVRAGGQLLLVLDPMLTGHYELAIGDPARPSGSALIPPVVERWGLAMEFDPDQEPAGWHPWVSMAGTLRITDPEAAACKLEARAVLATCELGEGRVTLLADAAAFEHRPEDESNLLSIMRLAFIEPESGK